MSDGIISQYGFLFQRYIFIDTVIAHASMDLYFTYEGVDDIDVNTPEELVSVNFNKSYIQVKSGVVSKECWAKVLGNWILAGEAQNTSFVLICENNLEFNVHEDTTIDAVYKYFEDGVSKNRKSIARKVHDALFENNNEETVKSLILKFTKKCVIDVYSEDQILSGLKQKIIDTYCTDIKVYEKAKQIRCDRIVEYFMSEIDESIKNKKKCVITFQKIMDIVGRVRSEISDNKFTVNTADVKKKKQKEANDLIENGDIREIRQLKLVKNDVGFIAQELVKELLYKDFREVYVEGGLVISNIEDAAYTNYQDALLELDGSNPSPKQVFMQTTRKVIDSSIMDNSSIYRNGCYVYLTGENIDEDKQISWGKEDE